MLDLIAVANDEGDPALSTSNRDCEVVSMSHCSDASFIKSWALEMSMTVVSHAFEPPARDQSIVDVSQCCCPKNRASMLPD